MLSLFSRTLCNVIIFILGAVGYGAYLHAYGPNLTETEQHALCFDTDKYEAWVAHKNGELRCFMEYKDFPHKVKASYID